MIGPLLNILTAAALLSGLFFMFAGALGVWRLPDFFNRTHAASKCVTLGISGLLLAAVLHFAFLFVQPGADGPARESLLGAAAKALLVVIFLYTAAPVGSHMLARAAHRDGAKKDRRTLGDALEEDRAKIR